MEDRFNPLKILRWTDRIQLAMAGVREGPICAQVDLTNLCNHSCDWCEPAAYREETVQDQTHTLSTEVAEEVLDDLARMGCSAIYFSGGGEPTLHKAFGHMLYVAHNKGMKTLVVTNGSMLERWESAFSQFCDQVRISLDAVNEETHMKIHHSKRGGYGEILRGIKLLLDKRIGRKPEIGIAYTVEERNWGHDNIRALLEKVEDLGVDFVQFRPCSVGQSFAPVMPWIQKEADNLKMRTKVFVLSWRGNDVATQRDFSTCYAAYTLCVVGANGDVQACCDERGKVFGNVYRKRLKDIWLSPEHRHEAAKIVPQLCPRCLMCGFNKTVEHNVMHNNSLVEFVR